MSVKNFQMNLLFNADTTQAQQNIQQLSKLLHEISNTKIGISGGALSQAAKDAQALSGHLANAVNTNTGKLDLGKLNTSLASAKTSLSQLTSSLAAAGPIGQQAFLKIATAISQAEAPTMRMSASMKNLLTTVGNTAKWQLASTAIHGVTGAISESIRYIEKFDKALTDIKIVSDLNNDQLLQYAETTKKIAKEVNATALEVAQGSTLYFQQGLSEAEVEKRIAVTQKLANVTGETSATVTSQMTSIWNNFDNGTKSLESYADTLTYLGATTAADTNQIATAMEKFAASATTVGLSYEYAASAVSQVIDRTQMAPEEVGTAFKTILSRMQGLKLGKTLEDGVDLNKYGQALDTIGVKVLDANDQLRDADDILDDLGEKWTTLDAAEKKAVATTVAGVRQQTQFIALMEEWDDIEKSVSDLGNATGYLTKQNDEVAQSVAGLKKRYEEAKNTLYDSLLSEDTLKGFYSSMEGVFNTITKIVDTMGGLGPIILTIVGLFSKQLIPKITSGISNMVANISLALGVTENRVKAMQAQFEKQIQIKIDSGQLTTYEAQQLRVSQMLMAEKKRLLEISQSASNVEKEQINNQIQLLEVQGANVQKAYEEAAVLDEQLKTISNQVLEMTKKQTALDTTTQEFKNTTNDWSVEDSNKIADMAHMDSAEIANRKKALEHSIGTGTQNLGDIEADRTAMEKELELNRARLAAKERQKETVALLQDTPDATNADRNALSNDLVKQLPPELKSEAGSYSFVTDSQEKIDEEILSLKEKIADAEKEINALESDKGPLETKKNEIAEAEKELKMLQEAELLKKKANSKTIVSDKNTKITDGKKYEIMSVADTGDTEAGTELARQAIAQIGQAKGEEAGKESLQLTTDETTGERTVNTDTESTIANYEALKQKQGELIAQSEQLEQETKGISAASKQLINAQTEAAKAVADHGKKSQTAKKAQAEYAKELARTRKNAQSFSQSLSQNLAKIKGDKAKGEIEKIDKALEKINATDDAKEIESALKQIEQIAQELGIDFKNAVGIIDGAAEQMAQNIAGNSEEAKAKLSTLGDTALQEGQQMAQAEGQFAHFGQTIKDNEDTPVSWSSKLSGTVSSLASFASSCQMALSGMQVFMSAFEEGASPMQRFTAIMSGLSMLLPVVAAAIGLVDKAQKAETKSTIQSMIAKWAENAAWYASPVLWIPVIIMAAVAAIAFMVSAIMSVTNALSAEEQQLANAQANLETLTAAYDAAKQKAQEFKDAISGYEDARAGLKDLEKGTIEYSEQLRVANEEASELIRQFSQELQGKYEVTADGEIIIDEEAMDEVQKKLNDSVIDAALAKNRGELEVVKAQYEVDKQRLQENTNGTIEENMQTKWFEHYNSLSKEQQQVVTKEDIAAFIDSQDTSNALSDEAIDDMSNNLMDNSTALDTLNKSQEANIEALQANTKALLKEKYGSDFVDKYGAAAVEGAEQLVLDEKAKNFQGSGQTATAYYRSKNLNGGGTDNNDIADSELTEQEIEYLAAAAGIEAKDIRDGEFEYDSGEDGGKWVLQDNDGNVMAQWTGNQFDKLMAEQSSPVTQEEVEAKLSTDDGLAAAQQKAVDSGLYTADQVQRATGAFAGVTEARAQELENKDFGEYEEEVQKYFDELPAAMKESMAGALAQVSKEDIAKAGSVEKLMEQTDANERGKAYAAELNMDEDEFRQYTDHIQESSEALADNRSQAQEVAKAQILLDRKLKTLGETYSDLKEDLNASKIGTEEFNAACGKMADGLKDVFGVEVDSSFVEDNLNTIKNAMNGDVAAMQQLQDAIGEEILVDITPAFDASELDGVYKEVNDWIGSQQFNNLEIGATLDSTGMTDKFQEMLENGEITVEEMNKLLKGIGFNPQIDYVDVPLQNAVKDEENNTYTVTYEDPVTGEQVTKTISAENVVEAEGGGKVQIPVINSQSTTKFSTPKSMAKAASKGSDGGGGKPKTVQKKAPIKKKDPNEEIERYHEITEALSDQQRVLDRLATAKSNAYGANYLKLIDKEIEGLKELNKLDVQHLNQIQENLQYDKEKLTTYGITFDDQGNINNYDEIMQAHMDKWYNEQVAIQNEEYAYEEKKNADENYDADGSIKLALDQRKSNSDEYYEQFKSDIAKYEETDDLFESTLDKIDEQIRKIGELKIEAIEYEAEMNASYNEMTAQLLDFNIAKLGDGYEVLGEIAALTAKKFYNVTDALEVTTTKVQKFKQEFANGTILFDQLAQKIEENLPDLLSQTEDLLTLDQEMMEYYGQAFDKAQEEFSTYLDYIEYGIGKLDQYRSLLTIIGKESDNAMMDVLLKAQQSSLQDRYNSSKNWYDITKAEYDAIKARYDNVISGQEKIDEKEMEMLEEKLKVSYEKMNEADQQRLSDLQALGEKAQEILQNNLDAARKKLEQSLVGSSLEDYMNDLDRLSKKQEEYLTTTNKMYETNKLIRQAQLDMDKTENQRAKQQYNDYVKYIQQLQQSGQLSQYELSIAQAKYELLQAQIALEEAQEAKNQVRLTRDAEGNYGYVYTADQDKVSDAEQKVADAENNLYNIGLEGAQDYQSKKAEILQEAIDTFASLEEQYQTGQIASEAEFQQKMSEAKEYYYGMLKSYDELYYLALGTMQDESYQNTVDYELDSTDIFSQFEDSVNNYLTEVNDHFNEYNSNTQIVRDEVGDSLETLQTNTQKVSDETHILTEKTDDLVGAMEEELGYVREITSYWGGYREELYKTIEANSILIDQLRAIQQTAMTETNEDGELNDYSSAIADALANGMAADDPYIQGLIAQRDRKLNGVDTYDYSAMMAKVGKDDPMYAAYEVLRQHKIDKMNNVNYETNIRDYISNGGNTTDATYQNLLTMRGEKIKYEESKGNKISLTNDALDAEMQTIVAQRNAPKPEPKTEQQTSGGSTTPKAKKGTWCTIEYVTNLEGVKKGPDSVVKGKTFVPTPASYTPVQGKSFDCWCTDSGLTKKYDNSQPVQGNMTLYAKWKTAASRKFKIKTNSYTYFVAKDAKDMENNGVSVSNRKVTVDGNTFNGQNEFGLQKITVSKGAMAGTWYKLGSIAWSNDSVSNAWIAKGYVEEFDTGGYTGSWGPEGRMAMLHEKELILNKQDTENFLAGTEILREITHMLDTNAMIASLGAFDLRAMTMNSLADQVLQQEVTIHADFPNVSDHNEIEIAIDNLINAASQHAYRI